MRPRRRESLCEGLNDNTKYTPTDIANTISQLSKEVPETTAQPQSDDVSVSILEYIKKVEGYRIRLREIHWSTEKHSEHVLTDSLISELTSHEDAVAEVAMGVLGIRIKVGQVIPTLPEETDLKSLLFAAVNNAIELKSKIEDNPQFAGLSNLLDDCVQELSKGRYLETLS